MGMRLVRYSCEKSRGGRSHEVVEWSVLAEWRKKKSWMRGKGRWRWKAEVDVEVGEGEGERVCGGQQAGLYARR